MTSSRTNPHNSLKTNIFKGKRPHSSLNASFCAPYTTGVVTDLDGNYTIKVKPGDVLTFSYLGMQTKEVKVGKQSTVNVTLAEDQKLLDAVVVVGYGTMRKSDLTGAVTQVGDKAIEKTVSTSIDQVLQGRAQVCRFRQTPVLLVVLQPSVSVVPTHSTHHHSLSSSSTV